MATTKKTTKTTGAVKKLSVKDAKKLKGVKAGACPYSTGVKLTDMGMGDCTGCTCTTSKVAAKSTVSKKG